MVSLEDCETLLTIGRKVGRDGNHVGQAYNCTDYGSNQSKRGPNRLKGEANGI